MQIYQHTIFDDIVEDGGDLGWRRWAEEEFGKETPLSRWNTAERCWVCFRYDGTLYNELYDDCDDDNTLMEEGFVFQFSEYNDYLLFKLRWGDAS